MGKQDEIEVLYHTYSRDLYRYLFSMCHNQDGAEDLLQITFMQVIRGIGSFQNRSSLKTWMFSIARHEFYRWLKKRQDTLPLEETVPVANILEEEVERRDTLSRICVEIEGFSEPHRSLLILRLANGLSFWEIGDILGRSEVWARVTFMRDKTKLVEALKED